MRRDFWQSAYKFLVHERVGFRRPLPLTSDEEREAMLRRADLVERRFMEMQDALAFLDLQLDLARERHHTR